MIVRRKRTFSAFRYSHPNEIPDGVLSMLNELNNTYYGVVVSNNSEMNDGDYVVEPLSENAVVYDPVTFAENFEEILNQ